MEEKKHRFTCVYIKLINNIIPFYYVYKVSFKLILIKLIL